MKQQHHQIAVLGALIILASAAVFPARGEWNWKQVLGLKTTKPKPPRVWTPKRGPVFSWKALSSTPLNARELGSETKDGIVTKEVMFHSEMDGKKSVEIFAYFSYPEGKKNLPAFVWIEGGLAQAKPMRTIFGAKRGYATLAIDFPLPGYRSTGDYPINLGMFIDENPRQAPIYHGAVALLKAVSFLEAQPQVDKEKIGMAGGSWGGFFTTLMTGIDPRIKAAACLYGSGNLQMGNMWWDAYGRSERFPPIVREHWRTTLDPAFRLPKSKTPIAWFTGTNDWFFWMPAVMKTYEMTGGPKSLTLLPNWDHAVSGEIQEQPFIWLDQHLKGKPGLLEVSPLKIEAKNGEIWASWDYSGPRRARRADVIVSWGEAGNWHTRSWQTLKAKIRKKRCVLRLPEGDGKPFFLAGSVTDKMGLRVSTPLVRVNPTLVSVALLPIVNQPAANAVLATDGCSEWGDFEWSDCVYLRRHKWWTEGRLHDALSSDAFEGQKSIVFSGGTTRLPMLHFTEGYRHKLQFWAKSETETTIGVRFNAGFCGESKDVVRWAKVGLKWTKIEMEVSPHEDLFHRYNASLILPLEAQIKADEFSFRPVRN